MKIWTIAGMLALVLLAWTGHAKIDDYMRGENPISDGVTMYTWVKDTEPKGRAWAVKIDLSKKKFRVTTRFGKTNKPEANRATVAEMAEQLKLERKNPLFGLNGDYFSYEGSDPKARPFAPTISDSLMVDGGSYDPTATSFYTETADHELSIRPMERTDGGKGSVTSQRQVLSGGKKVRNAARTAFVRYRDGHEVDLTDGKNDDGEIQYKKDYPRSMVGIGKDTLVFFVSDGRQKTWSVGVECKDATEMIRSLGCSDIGEFDGGGSAGMWARDIAGDKGNHYVNHPCDGYDAEDPEKLIGNPRKVAQGIFILEDETPWQTNAVIQTVDAQSAKHDNPYETLDEALTAVSEGEMIQLHGNPVPLKDPCNVEVSCQMMSIKGKDFAETPVQRLLGQTLTVKRGATLTLNNVAFQDPGLVSRTIYVEPGGNVTVAGPVQLGGVMGIEDVTGFTLAADPGSTVLINGRIDEWKQEYVDFGKSTLSAEALDKCITRLVNQKQPDWIATVAGTDADGRWILRWRTGTVRVAESGRRYATLDEALQAVPDNGTAELLFEAPLNGAQTIGENCTIKAAEGKGPLAIQFAMDASLTVGAGTRVLFSDVGLGSDEDFITVAPNGIAAVKGTCANATFVTEDASGLEVAGAVTSIVRVDCKAARTFGTVFAVAGAGLDLPTAESCAVRFVNVANDELVGQAFEDDGAIKFRWIVADVPDSEAKLKANGANFLSFRTLLDVISSGDVDIELLKDCVLTEMIGFTNRAVTLTSSAVPSPCVVYTNESLIVVGPGASLEVTGVTLTNATAYGAILVDGEDAKLTLGAGTVIRDCRTKDTRTNAVTGDLEDNVGFAGGVSVWQGEAMLKDGCEIFGCRGEHEGGAVYVFGGAELDLEGCVITNNVALQFGGGVYVGEDATVNVSGDVTVRGNFSEFHRETQSFRLPDDVNLFSEESFLVLNGPVTSGKASIGVRYNTIYEENSGFGNEEGDAFAYAYAEPDEDSAAAFFCDELPRMTGEASEDETMLVWKDPGDRLDPDDPAVRVLLIDLENNVTNCYATVDPALRDAIGFARADVVLLANAAFSNQVQVSTAVKVRSDERTAEPYCLIRDWSFEGDAIVVGENGALTFENLTVSNLVSKTPLVELSDGGSLTLASGASLLNSSNSVPNVFVNVDNGGRFVMESGSLVSNSVTVVSTDPIDYTAAKPAVFADCIDDSSAVVEIRGGRIAGFETAKSFALYVGTNASVRLSGDATLAGNVVYLVTDTRAKSLELAGDLTGVVDIVMGENVMLLEDDEEPAEEKKKPPEGLFGFAAAPYDGASHFTNAETKVCGIMVTNNLAKAWLVWKSALKTDPESGLRYYEFEEGGERFYERLEGTPVPPPGPTPPEPVTTNYPGPIAFKSIDRLSETSWLLVITNRVQWCRYRLIWTDDLTKGFTTTGGWEQVAEDLPEWKTNVVFSAEEAKPAYFWKAEGTWGIVPKE